MSGGWVQVYRCLCSDSATDETALPDACPGHNTRVVGKAANTLEGGVPDRHDCANRPCPPASTTADRGAP